MEGQPRYNAALKCYSEAATSKFGSCKNSLWCSVVLSILGVITKWTLFASLLAVFNYMETVFGNIECLNLAEKGCVHLKTDLVKVAVLVAFHCFIKNLSRSIIIFHTAT